MFVRRLMAAAMGVVMLWMTVGFSEPAAVTEFPEESGISEEALPRLPLMDSASAAVVYCADNGQVLYGHDIHQKRAIASITKIMTAVIALETTAVQDPAVTVTAEMYAEGSSMYLKAGEVLRLSELVKGMMAVSGNDAANAVALTVAGSAEAFAERMNRKAAQLGMENSHFVTPSGLDDGEHYSTAYDMARLCSYAMKMEAFREIVSQRSVEVSYLSPEQKKQQLFNHNRLLSMCDGCIGIKTGFTLKAGRTLTSCAERDGVRLIVVTLNDRNDWKDHCKLYDWGFSQVCRWKLTDETDTLQVPLVGGSTDTVLVAPCRELCVTVPQEQPDQIRKRILLPPFLYAPLKKGEEVGRVEYFINEQTVGTVRLRVC